MQLHNQIAEDKGILLREQEVMPDYVCLFITAHPKFSPSQIVKIFKGITAKSTFEKFPELKKQMWMGASLESKLLLWNDG